MICFSFIIVQFNLFFGIQLQISSIRLISILAKLQVSCFTLGQKDGRVDYYLSTKAVDL